MSTVVTSLKGGIYEITMNRPKQLNALNWELLNELIEAIGVAENDSNVRCIVIRGEGQHFMAGGDILYFHKLLDWDKQSKVEEFSKLISTVHEFVENIAALPVPVIASVRGAAAGFGISLVAGCDLAIASTTSFYTSAYNLLGTSPDGGSTYYLSRSVGAKKAMEIVLTTKRYSAQDALQMGLINKVVEDGELEKATAQIAGLIENSSRIAVRNAKRLVRNSFQSDLTGQLQSELDCFLECAVSEDFAEGVRAFVEKRKPEFAD